MNCKIICNFHAFSKHWKAPSKLDQLNTHPFMDFQILLGLPPNSHITKASWSFWNIQSVVVLGFLTKKEAPTRLIDLFQSIFISAPFPIFNHARNPSFFSNNNSVGRGTSHSTLLPIMISWCLTSLTPFSLWYYDVSHGSKNEWWSLYMNNLINLMLLRLSFKCVKKNKIWTASWKVVYSLSKMFKLISTFMTNEIFFPTLDNDRACILFQGTANLS